jgi:hypothetical protein
MTIRHNVGKTKKEFIAEYQDKKSKYLNNQKFKAVKKTEEKEKFLEERKTKTFKAIDLDRKFSDDLTDDFRQKLTDKDGYKEEFKSKVEINVQYDTLGQKTMSISTNPENTLPPEILSSIRNLEISAPKINGLYINFNETYSYDVQFSKKIYNAKKRESELKIDDLIAGDQDFIAIKKDLNGKEVGNYTVEVSTLNVDNTIINNSETIKYKKPVNILKFLGVAILLAGTLFLSN